MIGLLAGALTTVAFVPQVVKVYRTRSTGDGAGVEVAVSVRQLVEDWCPTALLWDWTRVPVWR